MKRLVILIDGTWNEEGTGTDTNVARLDPAYGDRMRPLIKPASADGTVQRTFYHAGVGTEPDAIKKWLGGAIGLGLKQLVQDCYATVVANYQHGDEIYIFGFSRGAYAARALAGLIGASGIRRQGDPPGIEAAWRRYRATPATGAAAPVTGTPAPAAADIHADRAIKCVGVWDTVGSYGIPAGIGLAALARYVALLRLGFHDTLFGDHIDVGLHAVALDEKRRPFVPTFWTIAKGERPRGTVEQTWFAGVHCNIGGGYADRRLADEALLWMIARVTALTGLEFDAASVRGLLTPDPDGEVYDSSKGWVVDELAPHLRVVLSPDAIRHGYLFNTADPRQVHINERVHWSLMKKCGRPCTVDGVPGTLYRPANLPGRILPEQIADMTAEEAALLAPLGKPGV